MRVWLSRVGAEWGGEGLGVEEGGCIFFSDSVWVGVGMGGRGERCLGKGIPFLSPS